MSPSENLNADSNLKSPHVARLFVTFELPPEVREILERDFAVTWAPPGFRLAPGVPADSLKGHDLLLVSATQDRLDAEVLGRLPPEMRAVATYSVGNDHIDLAAAKARGIAVFSTPDVLSAAVAETGLLLMLGAARRVTESVQLVRGGQWRGWSPTQLNGWALSGKVLGIFGMGRIGREIAARARGFGMAIHYANRSRLAPELEQGAVFHDTPESLLGVSQFFMLACPATPQTTGFLDQRRIGLLPQGAIVANVGRGATVVDADLVEALASGRIAAAGLDVFNNEPAVYPGYLDLPTVFMLPHIGSSTIEARMAMGQIVADGFVAFGKGLETPNRIA
ncbi:MAG: D-glycerate dehydrogenase [Comamonadaceae bacterium]|nr:MAG: D-glycerate dehydrogenase [Comamonadaceae bacterium]